MNLHSKVNDITRNECGNKRRNIISTFSTIWIMNDSRTCAVLSFSNVIPRSFALAMFHRTRLCVHNDLETLVERVVERAIVLFFACCPWIQHVTVIKTYYEIFRISSSSSFPFFVVSNERSFHDMTKGSNREQQLNSDSYSILTFSRHSFLIYLFHGNDFYNITLGR